ncbi:hypothetical protein SEUCBS139899_002831 [Sporothrix eucalyptigena]|uniref:Uncharacterized protein n=1 Tax=Sporothrix eucalyptigena TaxID=1812306 RepID=A0ABP0BX66_9PEZI
MSSLDPGRHGHALLAAVFCGNFATKEEEDAAASRRGIQQTEAVLASRIRELYVLWPALDDSSALVPDDQEPSRMREPDERDLIFRLVFRELVAQRADADVLARATRTPGIDRFLHDVRTRCLYFAMRSATIACRRLTTALSAWR